MQLRFQKKKNVKKNQLIKAGEAEAARTTSL